MTNFEKSEYYRSKCEAWILFYQGFQKSTEAILNCRALILDMQVEVIKAAKLNPENPKIKASQNRISMLDENLDILESLNSRCLTQQKLLKEYKEKIFHLENEVKEIKKQEKEGLSL